MKLTRVCQKERIVNNRRQSSLRRWSGVSSCVLGMWDKDHVGYLLYHKSTLVKVDSSSIGGGLIIFDLHSCFGELSKNKNHK